jgi:hypothetical protein
MNTLTATKQRRRGQLLSRAVGLHFAWAAFVVILLLVAQLIAPAPGETSSYGVVLAPFAWVLVALASLPIHLLAAAGLQRLAFRIPVNARFVAVAITCTLWGLVGAAWLLLAVDAQPIIQLRTAVVFALAVPLFGAFMPLPGPEDQSTGHPRLSAGREENERLHREDKPRQWRLSADLTVSTLQGGGEMISQAPKTQAGHFFAANTVIAAALIAVTIAVEYQLGDYRVSDRAVDGAAVISLVLAQIWLIGLPLFFALAVYLFCLRTALTRVRSRRRVAVAINSAIGAVVAGGMALAGNPRLGVLLFLAGMAFGLVMRLPHSGRGPDQALVNAPTTL